MVFTAIGTRGPAGPEHQWRLSFGHAFGMQPAPPKRLYGQGRVCPCQSLPLSSRTPLAVQPRCRAPPAVDRVGLELAVGRPRWPGRLESGLRSGFRRRPAMKLRHALAAVRGRAAAPHRGHNIFQRGGPAGPSAANCGLISHHAHPQQASIRRSPGPARTGCGHAGLHWV